MSNNRILIVYGTRHGQTEKIADRICQALTLSGCAVTILPADDVPEDFELAPFDGIIVGASVIVGKHQPSVERFVMRHRASLTRSRAAFFSVSGTACTNDVEHQTQARATMDRFLDRMRWRPSISVTIAGALAYTKYGPITRWMMKQIARREGRPTDTSRDHEFTDWAGVEEFARQFAHMLPATFTAPDALGASI
jgi:menaquinone-dependent protoporphyrinogen oxidase